MKIVLVAVVVMVSLVAIYLFVLGQNSRSGNAPGLHQGLLRPCPDKPNCVSSEQTQDNAHYVEPINLSGKSVAASMQSLQEIILAQSGTIKTASPTYIAATFTSSIFGFVDDLEFRVDTTAGVIHLRSASRVGTSDLGANRKRVNLIKQRFHGN